MSLFMMAVVSCSKEETPIEQQFGDNAKVTYTVNVPTAVQTKTAGDGNTVSTLYYEVFYGDNTSSKTHIDNTAPVVNGEATITLDLVKEQTYTILFWAQKDNGVYDATELTSVKVDYANVGGKLLANQESFDAFYAAETITIKSQEANNHEITLTRPFAQLNMGTKDKDAAAALGVEISTTKVKVSSLPTQFNVFDGKVSGEQNDVEFTLAQLPQEELKVDVNGDGTDESYYYLSLNYLLLSDATDKTLVDITATFDVANDAYEDITLKLSGVPVERNYRTNIVGNLLTSATNFSIVVDEKFAKPDHTRDVWNGSIKAVAEVDGVYTITEAAELAWVAQQVNSGANSFYGKTVRLINDIDLNGVEWTKIGTSVQNSFQGTFEGAAIVKSEPATYPTIHNLYITNGNCAGLFGTICNGAKLQNFNLKGVRITGERQLGAVVGCTYSPIDNVTVEDAVITAVPVKYFNSEANREEYDNGDKVGGIVGLVGQSAKLTNSKVTKALLQGYRDLGGIVGCTQNSYPTEISGCAVNDIKLVVTPAFAPYNKDTQPGAVGAIRGGTRSNSGDIIKDNNEGQITKVNFVAEGVGINDSEEYEILNLEGFKWLRDAVNGGNAFAGKVVNLATDIDLKNELWTPIGNSETNSFKGAFNGNNHTISNLHIEQSEGKAGLFGYVGRDSGSNDGVVYGSLKNLKIHNVNMKIKSGAALCGNLFRGEVSGIELTGNVKIEGTAQNVAGVVGYHYGNLSDITVNVSEGSYVYSPQGYVGGVAAYSGEGSYTKKNIHSNINVKGEYECVGGLFALAQYGNVIENCSSNAIVENITPVESNNRYLRTGGIVGGWVDNSSSDVVLNNCSFTGEVKASRKDGVKATILPHNGIVGFSYNSNGVARLKINGKVYADVYKSDGLAAAVKNENVTVFMSAGPWNDGTIVPFSLPSTIADNVTVQGVKEAILNMDGVSIPGNVDNLTLQGMTVNWKAGFTSGFAQSTGHNYVDVTFNGAFFCLGQYAKFDGCTFNLNNNDYLWTYSSDVDFVDCTFNCENGKGVLIYNEGYADVDVSFNNCSFVASVGARTGNGQPVAAIEINNQHGKKYNVVINNSTANDKFAYNQAIWRVKDECVENGKVKDVKVIVDGVYNVTSAEDLHSLLTELTDKGSGSNKVNITSDIDMTGEEWTPIKVDGYHGADVITVYGNGKTIKGLKAPLFAGGFAGGSGIVIKDLTIDASDIVSTNTIGSGAFIESVDSMDEITMTNCHVKNSKITGGNGSRTGGLIGWTAGYNNVNDGPVKTYITIDNCSVINCEITCNGSVGGIYGHAGNNAWTYSTVKNCTVKDCKLVSTDDGGWRVGVVVGTANVGELTISNITESGNTLTQTGKTAPAGQSNLYGRFVPGSTGKLTINGVQIK